MKKLDLNPAYLSAAKCFTYSLYKDGKTFENAACKDIVMNGIRSQMRNHGSIGIIGYLGIGIGLGKQLKNQQEMLDKIVFFLNDAENLLKIPNNQKTEIFATEKENAFIFIPRSRLWYLAPPMMSLYLSLLRGSLFFNPAKNLLENLKLNRQNKLPDLRKILKSGSYSDSQSMWTGDDYEWQNDNIKRQLKGSNYLITSMLKNGPLSIFTDDIDETWSRVSNCYYWGIVKFSKYMKDIGSETRKAVLVPGIVENIEFHRKRWLNLPKETRSEIA